MEQEILNILNMLIINNYEAYLVGGFVRDYLLGKKSYDIDITTNAKPKEIMNIFKDYHPVSLEYGNVCIKTNKFKYEITTYRRDINYKDNRKPDKIVYIDSLDEDLLRRDFTINAICMDKNKKIIDKLNGKADLKKKLIKTIGNPDLKFTEDALRMLRAIRFATVLNFKLDEEVQKSIIKNKDLIKKLSYERKKEEINKIISSKNKKYGVYLLKNLGLLDVLELKNIDNVLLTNDLNGIWGTITNANYPFTKNEKDIMININNLLNEDLKDRYILYKYGRYVLSVVCDLKKLNKKYMIFKYDMLPIKGKEEIKITSSEICFILGKEPGPFIKEVYDDLEYKILNKELKNDNKKIKSYLKTKYNIIK